MAEKTNVVGMLISGFVVLLIGLVLIAVVSETTLTATQKTQTTETINVAPARFGSNDMAVNYSFHLANSCPSTPSDWRKDYSDCAISGVLVTNTSDTLVDNTDYYVNTSCDSKSGVVTGDLHFINATWQPRAGNLTSVTYSYCADGYMTTGWANTVLKMVPGFFALAIFLGAMVLAMYLLKRGGMFD